VQRNTKLTPRAEFTQNGEGEEHDVNKSHHEEEVPLPVEKKKRVPNVSKVFTYEIVCLRSGVIFLRYRF
jgi:hypothetical protein